MFCTVIISFYESNDIITEIFKATTVRYLNYSRHRMLQTMKMILNNSNNQTKAVKDMLSSWNT